MSTQTLSERFRPRDFCEVIGQLWGAVESGEFRNGN